MNKSIFRISLVKHYRVCYLHCHIDQILILNDNSAPKYTNFKQTSDFKQINYDVFFNIISLDVFFNIISLELLNILEITPVEMRPSYDGYYNVSWPLPRESSPVAPNYVLQRHVILVEQGTVIPQHYATDHIFNAQSHRYESYHRVVLQQI